MGKPITQDAFTSAMNKTITGLSLGNDDALHFVFDDGSKMKLFDDGQNCCEERYMRTDDELDYYIGSQLLDAVVKNGPDVENGYETHEIAFLEVKTSKGVFTMSSHNRHNGYYGGFLITAANEGSAA